MLASEPDRDLLARLVLEPIETIGREFHDGWHRVHALRRVGVERCVAVRR
jgi:hypothetical protein